MFRLLLAGTMATFAISGNETIYSTVLMDYTQVGITPVNNCIQFTVSAGTGCAWMCNYCANQLGTFQYYFPDSVCTYETGGCVGNPIAGKLYTCCST
jgi:hypothetical protein